jgi:hypothetical protein
MNDMAGLGDADAFVPPTAVGSKAQALEHGTMSDDYGEGLGELGWESSAPVKTSLASEGGAWQIGILDLTSGLDSEKGTGLGQRGQ